jgi:6-pyruvoyltetrahydropterin/6-carboxytetrahydropterin synthase
MFLTKKFNFNSAHKLPNYKGKCKNLHGHTYHLEITIQGKADKKTGMIIDFYDLEKIIENQILNKIDHCYLNDFVKNPTTENIANWIWEKLKKTFNDYDFELFEIKLLENDCSLITIRK